MRNRVQEIKAKGFDMTRQEEFNPSSKVALDFGKIKLGSKNLDGAILDIGGDLKKANPTLADKKNVLKAINDCDVETMREISELFYRTSGIYNRLLRYLAFLYRYDWYVTPYVNDESMKTEKVLKGFHGCLNLLDNFGVKKTLGEIALKVLKQGCYYGYKVQNGKHTVLQELPPKYCRSRFYAGRKPAVEFNMKYFDENFRDANQKMRILNLFPDEFKKGYVLYKTGKLPPQFQGDTAGWFLLDPKMSIKFSLNNEDYPAFISVVPLILDLDSAQELDRKRTMQRLLKIVVQKMPLDKNGDLVFDVDEAQQLHNNSVQMLGNALGLRVLTTFADVSVEDVGDTQISAQSDDLERAERQLFNEAGVSQMQFNTDGNLALEKSGLNDAATMYNLLLQFEEFLNDLIVQFNTSAKVEYKVQILTTTIDNYERLSKLYKEQTQLGYSKILPQLALGQTQSSILANAYFENDILDLVHVFIPPMSSNVMNAEILNARSGKDKSNSSNGQTSAENKAGRPEKEMSQKSEKTIQNQESKS